MRGVTDLRRYLNKSDNPYIVSDLDIERLGDPVSEPNGDEADKGGSMSQKRVLYYLIGLRLLSRQSLPRRQA